MWLVIEALLWDLVTNEIGCVSGWNGDWSSKIGEWGFSLRIGEYKLCIMGRTMLIGVFSRIKVS